MARIFAARRIGVMTAGVMLAAWAWLGLAEARAEVVARAIEYRHGEVKLEGYLAYDPDAAAAARQQGRKLPGVLIVHEWWGLNDYARGRARQVAELGYVAFALDMYGKGRTTEDPGQAGGWAGEVRKDPAVWRDRAMAGLDVLRGQEAVDPDRVAAMGYCFGGSTALMLAYEGAPIKAAVSFHGSLFPLSDPAPGRIQASLLVCHGGEDSFVKPEEFRAFEDSLQAAKADYQIVIYSGALHSFTNPDSGRFKIPGVGYQKEADQRSWGHMKMFFRERLGG